MPSAFFLLFFNVPATPATYTLSLHDALPISRGRRSTPSPIRPSRGSTGRRSSPPRRALTRSEEHTSELQSLRHLVCRLLLEKKKKNDPRKRAQTDRRQTSAQHRSSRGARRSL